jgi:hypothetical protein
VASENYKGWSVEVVPIKNGLVTIGFTWKASKGSQVLDGSNIGQGRFEYAKEAATVAKHWIDKKSTSMSEDVDSEVNKRLAKLSGTVRYKDFAIKVEARGSNFGCWIVEHNGAILGKLGEFPTEQAALEAGRKEIDDIIWADKKSQGKSFPRP